MRPTVLVTGASGGIGKGIVAELNSHGARVISQGFKHTDNLLGSAVVAADLRTEEGCEKLWQFSYRLDATVLINNAGIYKEGEEWQEMWEMNFMSTARLCSLFSRDVIQGRIINIASRVGQKGSISAPAYAVSKAAQINLTKSLAASLAPHIQVFAVAPSWVDTPMVEGKWDGRAIDENPMGRIALPQDVAGIVRFLALDPTAPFLNGAVIDVNGGSYLR